MPLVALTTLILAAGQRRSAQRELAEAWAAAQSGTTPKCACKDESLCQPVGGPPLRKREIFGFSGGDGSTLDFTRVTSVAWPDHPELVCAAHAHGARVILAAPRPEAVLTPNATARRAWVERTVQAVQASFTDGVTFDWEAPCAFGAPSQHWYATLIAETRAALRRANPSYQVSVCVAWSPDNIDGRGYNIPAFAAAADLLYVMDYDTRSQVFDACIAAANAPLPGTIRGLSRYTDLGIDPGQLVLGVPWYGYRYECEAGSDVMARFCPLPLVPFRGVNCSDAAGSEHGYAEILAQMVNSTTGRRWDQNQGSPWFNAVEYAANGSGRRVLAQYWYDDVQSLVPKYQLARRLGLRGVGPYTFSANDGTATMYEAFDAFLLPKPRGEL